MEDSRDSRLKPEFIYSRGSAQLCQNKLRHQDFGLITSIGLLFLPLTIVWPSFNASSISLSTIACMSLIISLSFRKSLSYAQ